MALVPKIPLLERNGRREEAPAESVAVGAVILCGRVTAFRRMA